MLYILYGEDTFRSRVKAHEIIAKFIQVAGGTEAITRLYAPDYTLADLRPLVETGSLFRDKRLVVLEEASGAHKEIIAFFEEKAPALAAAEDIFLFWDSGSAVTAPFGSLLPHAAKVQEFSKLAGAQLGRWIEAALAGRKIKTTPVERRELAVRTAGNMWRLHNELEKMQLTDAREAHIVPGISPTVFQLTDAIGLRQKTQAVALFQSLLAGGEAPEKIFSTIVWHTRSLASVKELTDQGKDQAAVATMTKLHPFVVKKAATQAAKFSRQEIAGLYEQLSALDTEVKQSRRDLALGLERILLSL